MTPHETVTAFLVSRFRNTIPGGVLGVDDPLISSGRIDSFGVLEVIAFLEDTFQVTIDPADHDLGEFETVNGIVHVVDSARLAG
jgi:acyl carrier protein